MNRGLVPKYGRCSLVDKGIHQAAEPQLDPNRDFTAFWYGRMDEQRLEIAIWSRASDVVQLRRWWDLESLLGLIIDSCNECPLHCRLQEGPVDQGTSVCAARMRNGMDWRPFYAGTTS